MPTKTIDLLTLASVREHPRVHEAQLRAADARRRLHELHEQHAAAADALRAEQHVAATGQRDDKRLRQRDDAVRALANELQIAELSVTHAEQAADAAYAETCVDVERELRELHTVCIRRLERALQDARRASHDAARLEDASGRFFMGGAYRREPGRPIPPTSWMREFGGPNSTTVADTRFEMWRKHCGVTFDE